MATRTVRGVLVAVLAVAAMLLLLDLRGAGPGSSLRGIAGAVAGPPSQALSWVRTEAGRRFGGAADEQARMAALEQELTEARAALGSQKLAGADADAARALAAALPVVGYRTVPARVVARAAPQDLTGAVTVSAGTEAGIRPGMVVIDAGGVIGMVAGAAPGVSTLRLTTDSQTRLAVRLATSREAGLLQGDGTEGAAVTLLDPLGGMAVGERVVAVPTADGVVPADLPLGSVIAVTGSAADLTRAGQVDPGVDASTLDRVAVLVPAVHP